METFVLPAICAGVRGNARRKMGDKGRTVHEGNCRKQVVLHLQVEASSEEVTHNTPPVSTGQHLRHSKCRLQTSTQHTGTRHKLGIEPSDTVWLLIALQGCQVEGIAHTCCTPQSLVSNCSRRLRVTGLPSARGLVSSTL